MPKVIKKKRKVTSAVDVLTPLKPPGEKKDTQPAVPLLSLSLSVSAMAAQMVDMANRLAELERAVMLHNQQIHQVVSSSNETIGLLKAQISELQHAMSALPSTGQIRSQGAMMAAGPGVNTPQAPQSQGAPITPSSGPNAVAPAHTNQMPQSLRPVPAPPITPK